MEHPAYKCGEAGTKDAIGQLIEAKHLALNLNIKNESQEEMLLHYITDAINRLYYTIET